MPLLANSHSAKAASAIQPHPAPGITIATARNRKHPRQFQSHWPAMRSSAKMCPSRTSGIRNQPSAYRAAPKPKNNVHTITNARTNVGLQPSRKAMPLHTPPIHRSSPRTSPLDRTQVKKRRDVLFFADQAAAVADMDSRFGSLTIPLYRPTTATTLGEHPDCSLNTG